MPQQRATDDRRRPGPGERAGGRIRIILADGPTLDRAALRCLLEIHPDVDIVGEAGDGFKAVRLAKRLAPSVLVATLTMPGLNGLEVARQLKEGRVSTAVVVVATYPIERNVVQALRNGALGYVVREAREGELIRAVRQAALGRRFLSTPLSARALQTWLERAKKPVGDPYERLTHRERQVLQLVAADYSSARIARRLAISPRTVEAHRASGLHKLGLANYGQLIRYALARRFPDLPVETLIPPTALRPLRL